MKLIKTISIIFAATIVFSSISFAYSTDQDFKINQFGQTYGTIIQADQFGYEPDLIAAIGTNGEEGYIKYEDENIIPNSPDEALALQEKYKNGRYIPLYKKDGITQIGEFFIQPSSDDLEVSLLKDAAGVYSPRSYINNAAGYNYYNCNELYRLGGYLDGWTKLICTSGKAPKGWMGAKCRIIKVSNGSIVAETGWKYNKEEAASVVAMTSHFTIAFTYYCKGSTQEWNGSSYWQHATYPTPNLDG